MYKHKCIKSIDHYYIDRHVCKYCSFSIKNEHFKTQKLQKLLKMFFFLIYGMSVDWKKIIFIFSSKRHNSQWLINERH